VWVSPDMYLFLPGWQMYVDAANGYLQDRFLFGTAYPALPFRPTVERFLALPFEDRVRPKLLYENARRLLGAGRSAS
jgi:predicted TIM-barrel fold metal-dependent hydrolase